MHKKYIAYLKNNPEGYWFKRKLYGWGWTPARWQGWMVLLVYIVINIYVFKRIAMNSYSEGDTLVGFVLPFLASTSLLFILTYLKGEKPKWQWGIPKEKTDFVS